METHSVLSVAIAMRSAPEEQLPSLRRSTREPHIHPVGEDFVLGFVVPRDAEPWHVTTALHVSARAFSLNKDLSIRLLAGAIKD